jgi:hypothetical protein
MRTLTVGLLTVAVTTMTATAGAEAPPVGRLPNGPTTTVVAKRGSFVAVALPRQRRSSGLVWRLARRVDPSVLRQVSEADVGSSVVIVFRSVGKGTARVVFSLTHGDIGSRAIRAAVYSVRIT